MNPADYMSYLKSGEDIPFETLEVPASDDYLSVYLYTLCGMMHNIMHAEDKYLENAATSAAAAKQSEETAANLAEEVRQIANAMNVAPTLSVLTEAELNAFCQ